MHCPLLSNGHHAVLINKNALNRLAAHAPQIREFLNSIMFFNHEYLAKLKRNPIRQACRAMSDRRSMLAERVNVCFLSTALHTDQS